MKAKIAYLITLYIALIYLYTVIPASVSLAKHLFSWGLLGLMLYIGVLCLGALASSNREEDSETHVTK